MAEPEFDVHYRDPELSPLDAEIDRECRKAIFELQQEYHRAAKPFIERICQIRARYPSRPILVPKDRTDG